MSNKKERMTEQQLNEQYVMELFESIQYLPEAEQDKFLAKMNETSGGGLWQKVKGIFGDPKAQIADLTKKLQDIDATFTQILAAIDEAVKLNPSIPAETVQADKDNIAKFQAVFQGLVTEAQGIGASMDQIEAAPAEEAPAEEPAEEGASEASDDKADDKESDDKADKVAANEAGKNGNPQDLNDEETQELMQDSKKATAGKRV